MEFKRRLLGGIGGMVEIHATSGTNFIVAIEPRPCMVHGAIFGTSIVAWQFIY
jgi:hypothetical protein